MDITEAAKSYLDHNAAESGADELIRDLIHEVERLRSVFNLTHGALLCIGSTNSNWSEYARNVAHEAGAKFQISSA